MHDLKNVTLFCIDDVDPIGAISLLNEKKNEINYGSVKIFHSKDALNKQFKQESGLREEFEKLKQNLKGKIEIVDEIPEINSLNDYSEFIINKAHEYIDTDFAMCVQRDGYPVNVAAWDPQFLEYDYIGAPWTWAAPIAPSECPEGRCVGNGGFSIRSKRLMEAGSKLNYNPHDGDLVEDVYICREKGKELQSMGIKFAPVEIALRFSIENQPWNGQFGFHGKLTIAMTEESQKNQPR